MILKTKILLRLSPDPEKYGSLWQERETLERKSEKTNVAPDSDWEREISKEDLVIDLKDNTVEDEVPTEPFKTFLTVTRLEKTWVPVGATGL